MNLALKKKIIMKSHPSYVSVKQRIVGFFTVTILLLQICLPTVASAARLLTNESVTAAMASPSFQRSNSNAYLYQQASFDDAAYIGSQNITTFRERLVAAKSNLGKPTFIPIASDITIFVPTYPTGKLIGDVYVQNRYIRQQVFELLGRNLIYANSSEISETAQINLLYENAYAYAQKNPSINFGDNLNAGALMNFKDMVWPEIRTIHNERVVVPVLYLTDETIRDNKVTKTRTEFTGDAANFGSISLNNAELTLGVRTITKIAGSLSADKSSLINSYGDINLVVGGTLNLIGSSITGEKNVTIFANEMNIKSVLVPFQDRYGSGTRLGNISSINSTTGNIRLTTTGNVTFEGGTATASNGSLTIKSGGNISILPLFATYQGQSTQNDWKVNSSSLDVIGSRLSAPDQISLIASGAINITASELISTQGGIELLAKNGIHIIDELEQDQIQKVDRKGKTTGQSSEFRTEAVRAILKAGKGVLLDSEFGDVILKATEITSAEGAQVNARNGKVHLLVTKELEEFHLQTVSKGTWTIKTRTEDVVHENNIQNAIVGGLQVQAKYGINVEYTGKEGATLKEQIEEYRNMPEMKWMAELYDQALAKAGPKLDWNQIEEIHQELKKTKRNLSPAAMAIIAICVAVATAGTGAALVGAQGTAYAAVANTALTTIATQAAQSVAVGDTPYETLKKLGSKDSIKNLAVSVATAGAMQNIPDVKIFEVANTNAFSFATIANQATQAMVNATVTAGISMAVNGGNSDTFKQMFIQTVAMDAINFVGEKLASKIGDAAKLPKDQRINVGAKYISHAALGCMTGALTSQLNDADRKLGCSSGAGGAVIGEYVGSLYADKLDQEMKEWIDASIKEGGVRPTREQQEAKFAYFKSRGVDMARLAAALTAFASGGDVNIAANSGQNAAQNNALNLALGLMEYLKLNGEGDVLKGLAAVGAREDYLTQMYDALVAQVNEYGQQVYKVVAAGNEEEIQLIGALLTELYKITLLGAAEDAAAKVLTAGITVVVESDAGVRATLEWNKLSEQEQNQIKGAGRIVEITMDAASRGRLGAVKNMIEMPTVQINMTEMLKDKDHPDWNKVDSDTKKAVFAVDRKQEAKNLFSKSANGITVGDRSLIAIPSSTFNAKIFSGASENEVFQYFKDLTGANQMPVVREIPGKGKLYVFETPEGNFNMRDYATSAAEVGNAWTIEIPNAISGLNSTTKRSEIKFLRD
ncbi:hypothetical protein CBP51_04550 [Cellvibrio mixtus]|uniref:DUF637 domain-containing protein n=1 Tax=Cellvibrio mixtus TaxID=39650 RepID=A0A266Q8Y1_9GAMM|nr:DUF637 domain-containing protein [Cellvibrio mixtus]OZY86302.1 hypothetical protein CBP51_04550 [Cellvibrio mixtus]